MSIGWRRATVLARVAAVAGLLVGTAVVLAPPGGATAASLAVSPSTGLTDGQSVTVTGTNVGASNFVAVVECGNADSNGSPLPGTAPTSADCYGAESVGTQTLLITADGTGTATTPYTVHTSNIGANSRKCISADIANFSCVIAMADVATQGKTLQIAAPILFQGQSPPTTTSSSSTSTSSTSSTTTSSTSTTTTAPSTTKASLAVSPSTGLTDGQSVTVTGTNVGASNFVAVVECGNADSNGSPLPGTAPTSADCYGAESVGTQTLLITADGSGTATTPYTVHTSNIGANSRKCISADIANFSCVIAMADVATQGKTLQIAAPILFSTTGTPPTSGGSPAGNSAPGSASAPGAASASGSTSAPGLLGSLAGLGAALAANPAAQPSLAASSTAPGGRLAFTGLLFSPWRAGALGLVLVDLGYLLCSGTRRRRRAVAA